MKFLWTEEKQPKKLWGMKMQMQRKTKDCQLILQSSSITERGMERTSKSAAWGVVLF